MEEFYQLKRKLEGMTVSELFEYAKEKYPEEENLGLGSKKIVVRRIFNLERNRMNEQEKAEN
jgi:hypothetical protein